ncbi:MAG: Diaminopimelate epimerase [Dehalococcoidia bacterium]|nr:Diaminopimelate epimerase [Dehalococcoidia bacterium]
MVEGVFNTLLGGDSVKFTKMHGAGNDYALIDARDLDADWPSLARAMCHRRLGVGADGILLVLPSSSAHTRMRMFNPDGSEAEMCGNGIRCLAKYVLERGIVRRGESPLEVETLAGVRALVPIWHDGRVIRARVAMGKPELRPDRVPVALPGGASDEPALDYPLTVEGVELRLTFVGMGNPHAVAFLDAPVGEFPLPLIGPLVEHHLLFPNQVNFSIVNVGDPGHLSARVWERGVGETLACGTGSCAIAVASRLHDYTDDEVDITLPGGVLTVAWDGRGQVYLEGPAEEVFEGEWNG